MLTIPKLIGLNYGPFLIMTIGLEKGYLIIEDIYENKFPKIKINPATTIAISEFMITPAVDVIDAGIKEGDTIAYLDEHGVMNSITVAHMPHDFKAEVPVDKRLTVKGWHRNKHFDIHFDWTKEGETLLTVVLPDYAITGYFNQYANEFFQQVLDHETTEH